MSSRWLPPLTSMGIDKGLYGKLIFDKLSTYIKTGEKPEDKSVESHLIIRESI